MCAVADSLSVPVDLAALAALGVISTAIAGAVEIQLKSDWKEPANLYLVGIARSGEGKSPMLTKLEAPLLEIERDRQEQFRTVQADAETQRAILEKRRRSAINEGKDDDAYKAARDLDDLPALALPRLVAHDATPEALVKLLSENGGRLGVISDEGGEVFELSFRYGNSGRANLGIYLHGWDGRRYVEDRAGRDPRTIDRTTLTMALMVQQVHLERLAAGLRTARNVAGLSQSALAWRASMNPSTVYRIEAAVRRTRLSTLQRIAEALVGAAPWIGDAERVTADLATLRALGWPLKASTGTGSSAGGRGGSGAGTRIQPTIDESGRSGTIPRSGHATFERGDPKCDELEFLRGHHAVGSVSVSTSDALAGTTSLSPSSASPRRSTTNAHAHPPKTRSSVSTNLA